MAVYNLNGESIGSTDGLSIEEKKAIIDCYKNVAWSGTDGKVLIDTLEELWELPDEEVDELILSLDKNLGIIMGRPEISANQKLVINTTTEYAGMLGASIRADYTSDVSIDGLFGIKLKDCGFTKLTINLTFEATDDRAVVKIALMACHVSDGEFYVDELSSYFSSGDTIDITSYLDNDYFVVKLNCSYVKPHIDITSLSLTLSK